MSSIFFNKVAGLQAGALLKKDPDTAVFLGVLQKFKNNFFIELLPWQLLWVLTTPLV